MLKTIGSWILSALKAVAQTLGKVLAAPFRALAGGGGGLAEGPPALAELDEYDPVAERERAMAVGQEMAALIQEYAAASYVAGAPAQLPKGLTPGLAAWARGLSYEECGALVDAEEFAVSGHIQGVFPLGGVRNVQPLETATWSRSLAQDHVFEMAEISEPASRGPR